MQLDEQPLAQVKPALEKVCVRKESLDQAAQAAMPYASVEQDHLVIPLQAEAEASVETESVHSELDPGQLIPESPAGESGVQTYLGQEWPDHFLPL